MPDKKKQSQAVEAGPSQSLLSRIFTPLTDAPSRMARDFTSAVDRVPIENPILARGKGFLMGATEGAGDLLSGMTSPFSIATMAAPQIGALRNAARAGQTARQAAMPRINARPPNINTIDVTVPAGTPRPTAPAIDVAPEFNNADEAIEYFMNKQQGLRGTPADTKHMNEAGRALEVERRAIERRHHSRLNRPSQQRRATDRKGNSSEKYQDSLVEIDKAMDDAFGPRPKGIRSKEKPSMSRKEADKKIDDLQAQFRRKQMKRVK